MSILRDFCAKQVYGNVDCTTVCCKGKDFLHDCIAGGEVLAEVEKVFKVGFVEGVSYDFDVESV
jgi:hypothetical protein